MTRHFSFINASRTEMKEREYNGNNRGKDHASFEDEVMQANPKIVKIEITTFGRASRALPAYLSKQKGISTET